MAAAGIVTAEYAEKLNEDLQHPFQCLAVATPPGSHDAFVLAACGHKIVSTACNDDAPGTVHEWTSIPGSAPENNGATEDGERPAKKQKTGKAVAPAASNVIKLAVSPDHQHAVAVTEDKVVRVFKINEDGRLDELSQRTMPKRPCAVTVMPDNATILCGDKFGDVYSLPLLPVDHSNEATTEDKPAANTRSKEFKPSADTTTVHTQRNRKALESQLKQKNLHAKTKEPLKFKHKLLLGHVSMLTDLAYASRTVDGKQRGYVLTADRDEHIRVSRGPPQSHIIEGYCLGHKDFVSKICLVPGTDLLVSGGGDDWIGVWDWPTGKLLNKIDVLKSVQATVYIGSEIYSGPLPLEHVAVSGIWVAPTDQEESALVVVCERVSSLLVCPIGELTTSTTRLIPLNFPTPTVFSVLDLASHGATTILSIDERVDAITRFVPKQLKPDRASTNNDMGWDIDCPDRTEDKSLVKALVRLVKTQCSVSDMKALDILLYGVANLRKRGHQPNGADGEGEEFEVGAAVEEAE